jgi:hypothetical protein
MPIVCKICKSTGLKKCTHVQFKIKRPGGVLSNPDNLIKTEKDINRKNNSSLYDGSSKIFTAENFCSFTNDPFRDNELGFIRRLLDIVYESVYYVTVPIIEQQKKKYMKAFKGNDRKMNLITNIKYNFIPYACAKLLFNIIEQNLYSVSKKDEVNMKFKMALSNLILLGKLFRNQEHVRYRNVSELERIPQKDAFSTEELRDPYKVLMYYDEGIKLLKILLTLKIIKKFPRNYKIIKLNIISLLDIKTDLKNYIEVIKKEKHIIFNYDESDLKKLYDETLKFMKNNKDKKSIHRIFVGLLSTRIKDPAFIKKIYKIKP